MEKLQEFDALRFCEDYSIPHWTEGKNVSPGWVSIQCPMCRDDSNHGGINPYGAYFYCWKCGGHSLLKVIKEITGLKYIDPIIKEYGWLQPEDGNGEIEKEEFELPGEPLKDVHKQYLLSRRFDPDFIERKYKVLGTTHHKEYPYRVITPVIYNGGVVSFLGRDYTNKQLLRHKDCSLKKAIVYHKDILYNIDNCKKSKALLVEGAYDTWRFGNNTCATLGIGWTNRQVNLLVERFSEVFVLFDKGEQAQESARKLGKNLNTLGVSVEILSTEYDEPDDFKEEDVNYLKKEIGI